MPAKTPIATKAHIRWMIRRDMPEVLAIEADSFPLDPWSDEDFIKVLRQRNVIGMVTELDDRVVAYMIYELHKNRLHVLNFAVSYLFRREGIGSKMVDKLKVKLGTNRSGINLEIRESNLAAQLFFREQGFKCIAVKRDFYEHWPDESAYLFRFERESTTCKD